MDEQEYLNEPILHFKIPFFWKAHNENDSEALLVSPTAPQDI